MLFKQHNKNIKSIKKTMGQAMGENWLKSTLTSLGLITLLVTPTFASSRIISAVEQERVEDTSTGVRNATVAVEDTIPPSDEEMPMAQAKNALETAITTLSQYLPSDTDDKNLAERKILALIIFSQNSYIAGNKLLPDLTNATTDLTYEAVMAEAKSATELVNTAVHVVANAFQQLSDETLAPQGPNIAAAAGVRKTMPIIFNSIIGNIFHTLNERFETIKANIEEGSPESYRFLKAQLGIFIPFMSAPFDDKYLTAALFRQDNAQHDSVFYSAHAATVSLMYIKTQTLLTDIDNHPLTKINEFSNSTPAPEDDELVKRAIEKITVFDLFFQYCRESSKFHDAAIKHTEREIAQIRAEKESSLAEESKFLNHIRHAKTNTEETEFRNKLRDQQLKTTPLGRKIREKSKILEHIPLLDKKLEKLRERHKNFIKILHRLVYTFDNNVNNELRARGIEKLIERRIKAAREEGFTKGFAKGFAKGFSEAMHLLAKSTPLDLDMPPLTKHDGSINMSALLSLHQDQSTYEDSERTNATNSGTFADTSDGDNDAVFPTDEDAMVAES